MARVFLTYRLPESGVALLEAAGHNVAVRSQESLITTPELISAFQTYEAVITLLTDAVTREVLLQAGPQLKVIANYAVGYDNIDIATAKERGIVVTNTPDILTEAVSEHAVVLLAALARRVVEADAYTRAGKYTGWRPELLLGTELKGRVFGIVGLGRIGRDTAQRAHYGFGMEIVYHDRDRDEAFESEFKARFCSTVDELLPLVDAVSLHVPLTRETRHLMNAERLMLMKPTAFLVNTARGPVVDEVALVTALREGVIAGAALDVFEHEPALTAGLQDLPNVILTPHIGSATVETRSAMSELAARNVIAVLSGTPPLTPVNA